MCVDTCGIYATYVNITGIDKVSLAVQMTSNRSQNYPAIVICGGRKSSYIIMLLCRAVE